MKVIFYDRKNNCEVSNEQLMEIKLVREVFCGCSQEQDEKYLHEDRIATLGYKSPKCPSYQNWDNCLNIQDLVFLRLESDDTVEK